MKKYLLFGIVVFILFVARFKALENANIGTYIGEGRFYSLSPYPTTQNMGFQTNTSVSGNSDLWSAIPTTTNWTYGQNGGALVQCGMSFVKDFYYSVTYNFLISSSNNYIHTSYTGWSGHQIGVCTNINCVPWTSFDTQSTGQEIVPYLNGDYIGSFTVVFKAPQNGTCVSIAFSSSNRSTNPQHAPFVGYKYASLGSAPLTASQIQSALSSSFSELQTRIDSMKNEQQKTNSKLDDLNSKQDQTNNKLDNIKDMDAPDSAKTKPDDSDYKNYEKAESDLTDKISDIPTDTLEIGIDANSSNFIFDTMNKLINAHPAVFSMFIAILSIGIIKLGLGR